MLEPNKLTWKWNKKVIPLENLDEKQLYSIKKSINNSENKMWFDINSDTYLKEINNVLIQKNKLYSHLKGLRVQRAIKNTDLIINGMIKCMDNTSKKQITYDNNREN